MTVFAQHGYGKTNKIETGIMAHHISGVILSPRDESPDNLQAYIAGLRTQFSNGITILFDPQFYATTVLPVRDGHLPEYDYYQSGLTRARFIAQTDIRRYVADTLNYQANLPLDSIISPSVLFGDFQDPWSQIALSMAQEAITHHAGLPNAPPLLLSLVMDEGALRSRDALDEFLDIITVWNVAGVYLVVNRNDRNYPALFDETHLANLMYLVYVLSHVNGLAVICGYTDLVGLVMHAVGANVSCTGWYNSLRQFSLARFRLMTGGRQPRPRYASAPLLNSILIVPELAAAYSVGRIAQVLSQTAYDGVMATGDPANAQWPPNTACLHHWEVLDRLTREVSSHGSVAQNLSLLEEWIGQGIAIYRLLEQLGITFESATGSREIEVWQRAIHAFRGEAGI